jgi:hypothetical protein
VGLAGETLKATLVWTDPPGDSLQNDLDLIVTTPDGRELHGNVAPDAAGFDRSNNVEQVVVPNIAAGIATVTVRAFRNVSPQSYCGGGADLVAAQKDLRLGGASPGVSRPSPLQLGPAVLSDFHPDQLSAHLPLG